MYIEKVFIQNYRNFEKLNITLSPLTVLIGENDVGKSNLFSALSLPLSSNNLDYNQKRLSTSDINIKSIEDFFRAIIKNKSIEEIKSKIPSVIVRVQFNDPSTSYEKAIVRNWLTTDPETQKDCFEIQYEFAPQKTDEFIDTSKELLKDCKRVNEASWFSLPLEFYEYRIISTNNGRQISYQDLQHVKFNTIVAERDDFSSQPSMKSNNTLTKLLITTLNKKEKAHIHKAYADFFKTIENTESFKSIIEPDEQFDNFNDLLENLSCTPNLPNLKNILSNITLQYGKTFLYQNGLGVRNLVLLLTLFSHFKTSEKEFNLCCIEEPEAHLCVNNLRLACDFIEKSTNNSSSLLQTIISSHNPAVINKLKIENVVVLTGNTGISLKDVSQPLQDYLRKRPNFDILKLLFADKLILVEGPTEEMLINTILQLENSMLNNIDVISIGHRGFTTFLDIWLKINKNNKRKHIGIIRDFDDNINTKKKHDRYDQEHSNITVRTTQGYTFENDFVAAGKNKETLSKFLNVKQKKVAETLIKNKAEKMLEVCDALLQEKSPIKLTLPRHISEVLTAVTCSKSK